ncbi:unnamed protein product [Pseudo-nitzschia multistriata]|uniref:Uncharacterized protein n=1 Tax=Pseudo-nitzschia multistriata TaxID=183589 RepID=A0A448Z764_9STRA|nr:unnamed protein product [Pseudo-nitzschia multistriata]
MLEENKIDTIVREPEPVVVSEINYVVSKEEVEMDREMMQKCRDLCDERILLNHRLVELQHELIKIRKEDSVLKMKSTVTLGNMQLEFDSIREDKQFFIEKRVDLEKKLRAFEDSSRLKEVELDALQSAIDETRVIGTIDCR